MCIPHFLHVRKHRQYGIFHVIAQVLLSLVTASEIRLFAQANIFGAII